MRKGQSRKFIRQFDAFVCEGDYITANLPGGFTARATIERDDCNDKPDERDCGFWPSLDPQSDGYIGPKSKSALIRARRRAEAVMKAWLEDDWFYCGVCVTIEKEGVRLTEKYHHALWGVECNYPNRSPYWRNSYLRDVANELLGEAMLDAETVLDRLAA